MLDQKLFGEKLRYHRNEIGKTKEEVAEKIGVSPRTISNWENGKSLPSARHMMMLLELCGFSRPRTSKPSRPMPAGMPSVSQIYKIGRGPSSSHTIGPERACLSFKSRYPHADAFTVTLFGSLAKTGKGHGTDTVIRKTLAPVKTDVLFDPVKTDLPHPNTMTLTALKEGKTLGTATVLSVGGGDIVFENEPWETPKEIYHETTFESIAAQCKEKNMRLWQYTESHESADFPAYMAHIWETMKAAIRRGLDDSGTLPGGLGVSKKAKVLYNSRYIGEPDDVRENRVVCAYAYAVSEQNASGETVVTAPTCGASGVLPAVMYYYQTKNGFSDVQIVHALETAGLIGNLIKTNASISGAECGCQAEIGSACTMAAAALAELFELETEKIECAAEIAMEHHLGLTCDPIGGLVQIPCIERNAVAAMRAINAVDISGFLWDTRKISLDHVIETMRETGLDLSDSYKETSQGGLAKIKL